MLNKKNTYILITGFIILLSFFSLYFFNTRITQTLAANNLLPKPETFTELYFNDHQSLPSKMYVDKNYSFSFTINNLEYKDMTYSYEVYVEKDDKRLKTLAKKTMKIPKGESRVIKVDFPTLEIAGKAAVVVNLKNKEQKIHFLIYE